MLDPRKAIRLGALKAKVRVRRIDRGWKKIQTTLKNIKERDSFVKAGLLANGRPRPAGELSNAELGIIHEFGTSQIPARPFIRPAYTKNRAAYLAVLRSYAKAILRGEVSYERVLAIIGSKMAADMKKYVTTGPQIPPPNAESTLRRKLAKTRKGSKKTPRTLVDTGRMVGSITYAVVKGRGAQATNKHTQVSRNTAKVERSGQALRDYVNTLRAK